MSTAVVADVRAAANQGLQAVQAGRSDLASQHFSRALDRAEDLADPRTRRDELAALSILFDESGFPDMALTAAEDSVALDRELGLDALVFEDLLNVGTAHLNLNNDAKAEVSFREALQGALARNQWANAASASTNLGNVFAKGSDMRRAIEAYEKSLEYLGKEAFDNTEINTRLMLLQASVIGKYDVDRTIDNARTLYQRFWNDLQDGHRQVAMSLIAEAVERYLAVHQPNDPDAWTAKTFPAIFT
jgi:tetratricopeptide (TPR) repeat protein